MQLSSAIEGDTLSKYSVFVNIISVVTMVQYPQLCTEDEVAELDMTILCDLITYHRYVVQSVSVPTTTLMYAPCTPYQQTLLHHTQTAPHHVQAALHLKMYRSFL